MKMQINKFIVLLIGIIFVLSPSIVSATTIEFGDDSYYWPGWSNGTNDDNYDTIGIPALSGGEAVITDGYLTELVFDQGTINHNLWGLLSPGDLFIDVDSNKVWDYVVDLTS